jgi:hypothetical protein
MARGSGVRQHGTARQSAEHDGGYSPNGESEHSRRSASTPKLSVGRRTDGKLLREVERALRKLQFHAREETNSTKLAKIEKNIEIKSKFLAKLKGQYADEHPNEMHKQNTCAPSKVGQPLWNWDEVTTIPGEGAFDPWDKVKPR